MDVADQVNIAEHMLYLLMKCNDVEDSLSSDVTLIPPVTPSRNGRNDEMQFPIAEPDGPVIIKLADGAKRFNDGTPDSAPLKKRLHGPQTSPTLRHVKQAITDSTDDALKDLVKNAVRPTGLSDSEDSAEDDELELESDVEEVEDVESGVEDVEAADGTVGNGLVQPWYFPHQNTTPDGLVPREEPDVEPVATVEEQPVVELEPGVEPVIGPARRRAEALEGDTTVVNSDEDDLFVTERKVTRYPPETEAGEPIPHEEPVEAVEAGDHGPPEDQAAGNLPVPPKKPKRMPLRTKVLDSVLKIDATVVTEWFNDDNNPAQLNTIHPSGTILTRFTDDDKAWLHGLTDDNLQSMQEVVQKNVLINLWADSLITVEMALRKNGGSPPTARELPEIALQLGLGCSLTAASKAYHHVLNRLYFIRTIQSVVKA